MRSMSLATSRRQLNSLTLKITLAFSLTVLFACDKKDFVGNDGDLIRIISTAPSNTEIISYLGMADRLVAIDRHSANVAGVPCGIVMLDFFFPDAEMIMGLKPDVIIASHDNAIGSGDDPFRTLRDAGIAVEYIPMSSSIEEIYGDIAFIADILGVGDKGEEIIAEMMAGVEAVRSRTAHVQDKKTVYFEVSAAPQMFTLGRGSFIDGMISAVNAVNIFGDESRIISPSAEAIIERNPDVILTNVNYIDDPVSEIIGREGFGNISAVINGHVYQIDADASSRASPRIVYALQQMSEVIYGIGENQ